MRLAFLRSIIALSTLYNVAVAAPGGKACRKFLPTFFRQPVQRQLAHFRKYDLGTQYTLYLCGMQSIHPPALYLAEPLAKRGAEAVNIVKNDLAETHDDLRIRDLVFLIVEIDKVGTYDVRHDAELLRTIRESVSRIRDRHWKETTEEMLARLEK